MGKHLRKKDRKLEKEMKPKQRVKSFEPIRPNSDRQRDVINAIRNHTLSFVTGFAGTGKTLLAVSEALRMLESGAAEKLVLIRPMVAVGKDIGYLPGNVEDKVGPYSNALLYYIDDLMGQKGTAKKWIEVGLIEMVPIALIRGLTFKHSVIILDEAQNTTKSEMEAVLTRIGENSKMIIVGDEDQKDIRDDSGLTDILDRLEHVEDRGIEVADIAVVEMGYEDIQRHEMLRTLHTLYTL